MRRGKQMQHGVGRAAHGDIERHGVLERLEIGDIARQDAGIVLLVTAARELHDGPASLKEQLAPVGMGRQQAAIAGQCQAQAPRSGSSWSWR